MVVILMGVAGSGKTTVGKALAQRLGWLFHDADDFHPVRNREKMRRGIPLDDNDRLPWLEAIRASILRCTDTGGQAVIACSALKQSYRDLLAVGATLLRFVYLKGAPELIADRLAHRRGHFFDPNLLKTQFADLEEPHGAIEVDISAPVPIIVDTIIDALQLSS